jgi:hypothetical protein
MDGCTNGDRVDEVRVGHVWQVGVVLAAILRGPPVLSEKEKKFQGRQKVRNVAVLTGPGSLKPVLHTSLIDEAPIL